MSTLATGRFNPRLSIEKIPQIIESLTKVVVTTMVVGGFSLLVIDKIIDGIEKVIVISLQPPSMSLLFW
jgi:hypothetical protein